MKRNFRNLLCASAAFAPFAIGAPVLAADQTTAANQPVATLEEVVVTAQKRSENLQIVPITVSAVSAKGLADSSIKNVQDLTALISGFSGPGENGQQSPHLRGIGSQVAQPGIENSVAMYVDGIYIGATSPALLNLSNVENVEVLKGPQGTLFGRNTTGGLIQITTRNPSQRPEMDAELGFANYNTGSGAIYLNTPVTSNIATNLAVQASSQGQGWGKNLTTGKDVDYTPLSLSIRNKWDIQLREGTKLNIIADYEKVNQVGVYSYRGITGEHDTQGFPFPDAYPTGYYIAQATGWNVVGSPGQNDRTEGAGLAGRLSQDLGFATVSDTLAYRRTRMDIRNFGFDTGVDPGLLLSRYASDFQWTNELQIASNSSGPLKWTAGAFYYNDYGTTGGGGPFGGPNIKDKSYALFGQADYKFPTATTLTLGARVSYDDHSEDQPDLPPGAGIGNPHFDETAEEWRVALSQQLTDQAMIYASYNRGVKPGGYNPVVAPSSPFVNEQLDAYEIGSKTTFWDNKARLNLAAFYYNYKNIQVAKFVPGAPPAIYNGAAAMSDGLDADLELRPISHLTINANMEVLHSEFTNFAEAATYVQNTVTNQPGFTPPNFAPPSLAGYGFNEVDRSVNGNDLPNAPRFTSAVAATYNFPMSYGSWDLSGVWNHNSGYWTTPGHEVKQQPYDVFNASLLFTDPTDRYWVRVWGSNLGNAQIATQLQIGNSGSTLGLAAPREFGVTVGVKFR